jgi:two-component sensor histidine kinase
MQAEATKQLLIDESRHRIKNTLASVQDIAGQTLRHTPPEERQSFMARLQALAEAHDLLTIDNRDQTQLSDVVGRALKPFRAREEERFVIQGPALAMPAKALLPLTLCLHELATNAAKYGALSNGSGTVHLGWDMVHDGGKSRVRILWRELGGPPVTPPSGKGFGSLLLESSFPANTGPGLEFHPDGVSCTLELIV